MTPLHIASTVGAVGVRAAERNAPSPPLHPGRPKSHTAETNRPRMGIGGVFGAARLGAQSILAKM